MGLESVVNLNSFTLTQLFRLQMPETLKKADAEVTEHRKKGYEVVSETVLAHGDEFVRFVRLEREQPMAAPMPETIVGKLVREHGAERANQILQQESIDRAREAYEARRAHYRNNSIPLPVFPILLGE